MKRICGGKFARAAPGFVSPFFRGRKAPAPGWRERKTCGCDGRSAHCLRIASAIARPGPTTSRRWLSNPLRLATMRQPNATFDFAARGDDGRTHGCTATAQFWQILVRSWQRRHWPRRVLHPQPKNWSRPSRRDDTVPRQCRARAAGRRRPDAGSSPARRLASLLPPGCGVSARKRPCEFPSPARKPRPPAYRSLW